MANDLNAKLAEIRTTAREAKVFAETLLLTLNTILEEIPTHGHPSPELQAILERAAGLHRQSLSIAGSFDRSYDILGDYIDDAIRGRA